jgi:hypothetical protein
MGEGGMVITDREAFRQVLALPDPFSAPNLIARRVVSRVLYAVIGGRSRRGLPLVMMET